MLTFNWKTHLPAWHRCGDYAVGNVIHSGFTASPAYLVRLVTGTYMGQDAVAIGADFGALKVICTVFWMAVVLVITGLIVGQVLSGIEREQDNDASLGCIDGCSCHL